MRLLYRLLRQDPDSREGIILTTSALGIAVNALIAALKVAVGLMASSIAIVSEGVNNAADALTSILTLVGTKLAGRHPDRKHPFGYGRIEYLTGLVIAVIILVAGIETLTSSVERIFRPEPMSVSYLSIGIVAGSAAIKLLLGVYTMRMGRKAGSAALEAVGIESRNDSVVSAVTIVSALVFIIFRLSLDAYAGIFTSLFILKAGVDVLRGTVDDLLGRTGDEELAKKLYKEIRATDGVVSAADMMLHNYGPDAWSGSVNVEIDHAATVGEVYARLHELQLRIMHEYHVTMVFGIYAVDNDHEEVRELRKRIAAFVREQAHALSYHAVYIEPGTGTIYCDIIVDYELRDWDALRTAFAEYMERIYPGRQIELTIETEYV